MPRAVLFCNGEICDYAYHRSLLREDDVVIAVDGGGEHCAELGILPAVAIGDFDSLSEKTRAAFEKNGVEAVAFPADKDYIDMILGIEEAKKRGLEEILILGALGGRRVDMLLANVLALGEYGDGIHIENEWSRISFLRAEREYGIHGSVGDYVSLIPCSDQLITGESSGLKYPLAGLRFHRGETRSISNELAEETGMLRIKSGNALLVVQKR